MPIKTLFLEYSFKQVPVKKKLDRDLLWYDAQEPEIGKRLRRYRGGQLVTKYDYKTKKRYVEVKPLETTVYEKTSNDAEMKKWFKDVGKRLGVEINEEESTGKGMAIDFDTGITDVIETSLDRHGFIYSEL